MPVICGLRGSIHGFGPTSVELETAGVVYEIDVPLNVLSHLQSRSHEEVYLFIHHRITESSQRLYGFLGRVEREFFAALLGVKGIGGSLALSILSHIELRRLLEICEAKDEKALTHIPRVGKSIAATLMLEVNLRRKKWEALLEDEKPVEGSGPSRLSEPEYELDLALQGLLQLGYKEREAQKALVDAKAKFAKQKGTDKRTAADWISVCLKIL